MTDQTILMRDTSVPQMYDVEVSGAAVAKTLKVPHLHHVNAPPFRPADMPVLLIGAIGGVFIFTLVIQIERILRALAQWINEKVRRQRERNEFT